MSPLPHRYVAIGAKTLQVCLLTDDALLTDVCSVVHNGETCRDKMPEYSAHAAPRIIDIGGYLAIIVW